MRAYATAVVGLALAIGGVDAAHGQLTFGNQNFGVTIGPQYRPGPGYGYVPGYGYGYGGYTNPGYGVGVWSGMPVPGYYPYVDSYPNYNYRSGGGVRRSRSIAANQVPPRIGAGLPIKIRNPEDGGAAVRYSLNQFEYEMKPGESQSLVNDRTWVIEFDRGGTFGTARYTLSPGIYEFAPSDHGWEVYHDADVAKLLGPRDLPSDAPGNAADTAPEATPPK